MSLSEEEMEKKKKLNDIIKEALNSIRKGIKTTSKTTSIMGVKMIGKAPRSESSITKEHLPVTITLSLSAAYESRTLDISLEGLKHLDPNCPGSHEEQVSAVATEISSYVHKWLIAEMIEDLLKHEKVESGLDIPF